MPSFIPPSTETLQLMNEIELVENFNFWNTNTTLLEQYSQTDIVIARSVFGGELRRRYNLVFTNPVTIDNLINFSPQEPNPIPPPLTTDDYDIMLRSLTLSICIDILNMQNRLTLLRNLPNHPWIGSNNINDQLGYIVSLICQKMNTIVDNKYSLNLHWIQQQYDSMIEEEESDMVSIDEEDDD